MDCKDQSQRNAGVAAHDAAAGRVTISIAEVRVVQITEKLECYFHFRIIAYYNTRPHINYSLNYSGNPLSLVCEKGGQ